MGKAKRKRPQEEEESSEEEDMSEDDVQQSEEEGDDEEASGGDEVDDDDDDDDAPGRPLDDINADSDEELQEAFAAGLIKPGLNTMFSVRPKKEHVNDVQGLEQKLGEFQQKLPWIERLDLVVKPAPLAPELAYKEDLHQKEREKALTLAAQAGKKKKGANKKGVKTPSLADDPVHNDFLREMLFYRQAQAAVLEALPRLRSMNVKTKRPGDYFAQMAKTDAHMNRIRAKLVGKREQEERMEKVRKMRELKRFGKKVQVEVQLKRQKEKRDMLEQVKKFRKGQADSIDFLDDEDMGGGGGMGKKKGGPRGGDRDEKDKKASMLRRKRKDSKFGFGGKKRGNKANTRNSVNDTAGYRIPRAKGAGQAAAGGGGKNKKNMGQKLKGKRLGKAARQKIKNRRK